ncbi:MAG: tetratricopeptide repeat protein [Candidatus Omnitrophica bacterium]|nr:tetratricopeptide repeat protein [Candidatus Omnitrophota bacterium]
MQLTEENKYLFRRQILGLIFILAGTFTLFSPSLSNQFVNLDDGKFLLFYPLIRDFSWAGIGHIFYSYFLGRNAPVIPLTDVFYALECHFFQLVPFYYHLVSILVHLGNVILVFCLVNLLAKDRVIPILTALLFAAHPINAEAVVWVSAQKELFYTFFFLAAVISYIYWRRDPAKPWLLRLTFGLFLLSLLSKASAVTLPIILIMVERQEGNLQISPAFLRRMFIFLLTGLFFGLWTLYANYISTNFTGDEYFASTKYFSFFERFVISGEALLTYVGCALAPFALSCYHLFSMEYVHGKLFLSGIFLGMAGWYLIAALFLFRQKLPGWFFFGFGWTFFILFPVLHMIQMNDSLIYERFFYLPSVGFFFLLASAIRGGTRHPEGRMVTAKLKSILGAALVVYFAMFLVVTECRCFVWRNTLTLWYDAIKKNPNYVLPYTQLGKYYEFQGDYKEAQKYYKGVLSLNKDHKEALYGMGRVWLKLKEYRKAIGVLSQALSIDPTNNQALLTDRGVAYRLIGDSVKAKKDFDMALMFSPDFIIALRNRMFLLMEQKKYQLALADCEYALKINPRDIVFLTNQKILQQLISKAGKSGK